MFHKGPQIHLVLILKSCSNKKVDNQIINTINDKCTTYKFNTFLNITKQPYHKDFVKKKKSTDPVQRFWGPNAIWGGIVGYLVK